MTNYKKQLISVVSAGVMLLNVATPALAATTIEISGNGAGSDNWTTVNQTNTTAVSQNNSANVTNNVSSNATTGYNDANYNTGGDVAVVSGNATNNTTISNTLNSNVAEVDCCDQGDTDVLISGNGAFSDNGVTLDRSNTTAVSQNNSANVTNNVDANSNTGGNDAKLNTGGDVLIKTGNATTDVSVATTANVNSAVVAGHGGSSNPSASFIISGNGAFSDNYITAKLAQTTAVSQNNSANVTNNVDADANTGKNDANFNTGGEVAILTGHALVEVDVDNAVNFNHADLDCGCVWDVLAKISGNGAEVGHGGNEVKTLSNDGDNLINLTLGSTQAATQGNGANLTNNLWDLDAKTGKNDANLNTGEVDSDPAVVTGNAKVDSEVSNSGNVNVLGSLPFEWPELPEVEVSFNWAAFLAFFGMSH